MYTYKYTLMYIWLGQAKASPYLDDVNSSHVRQCVHPRTSTILRMCKSHVHKLGGAGFSALICSSVVTTAVPGVPWGGWEKLVSWSGSYYIPGVLLVSCTIRCRDGTILHARLVLCGMEKLHGIS